MQSKCYELLKLTPGAASANAVSVNTGRFGVPSFQLCYSVMFWKGKSAGQLVTGM